VTPLARAEIQALIARLGDGDREAIEPAFRALLPLVRRFSARALGNGADAEDAAQEALLKIFGRAASFDPGRDGIAWALAIASYECRTVRKRVARRREEGIEAASFARAGDVNPEDCTIERDLEAAAREAIAALGDEDARAVLAALADARPAGDASFRKRLERAQKRLRIAWRTKHGTG
jgi:RNA polymerase sigma-70 factor (ECF subfamily)